MFTAICSSATQVVDLSTGRFNGTGTAMPAGNPDDTYTVRIVDGFYPGIPFIPVKCSNTTLVGGGGISWVTPPANCKWISPHIDGSFNPIKPYPNATYYTTYRTTFTLDNPICDLKNVTLNLNGFAADNIVRFRINGTIADDGLYEENVDPHDIGLGSFTPAIPTSGNTYSNIYTASAIVNPAFLVQGVNTIDIIVTNDNNEYSWTGLMMDANLTINYEHKIPKILTTTTNFCQGVPLTFSSAANATNPIYHNWKISACNALGQINSSLPDYTSSNINGAPGTFTFPFTTICNNYYLVQLSVTNACQVTTTVSHLIYVGCIPTINAGADQTICSGSSATFNVTTSNWPVKVYKGTLLMGTYNSNPIILSPTVTTTYKFVTSTTVGCTASDLVTVTFVNNDPSFTLTPTFTGGLSYFTCSASPVNQVANSISGFQEIYIVEKLQLNGTTVVNSTTTTYPGVSCWGSPSYVYPNSQNFFNYNGAASVNCSGTLTAGKFDANYMFRITRGTKNANCPWKFYSLKVSKNYGVTSKTDSQFTIEEDQSVDYSQYAISTSILDLPEKTEAVNIYPNPSNGKFNIEFNNNSAEKITVFDALGKVVIESKVSENSNNQSLDLSDYSAGIYFVKVNAGEEIIMKKIVKQ